jgi:hypothetical protein
MNRLTHYNHPFSLDPGPTQPPVQWAQAILSGGEAVGSNFDHPYLSSAEVEDGVKLTYLKPSLCLQDMLQGEIYHYLCTLY